MYALTTASSRCPSSFALRATLSIRPRLSASLCCFLSSFAPLDRGIECRISYGRCHFPPTALAAATRPRRRHARCQQRSVGQYGRLWQPRPTRRRRGDGNASRSRCQLSVADTRPQLTRSPAHSSIFIPIPCRPTHKPRSSWRTARPPSHSGSKVVLLSLWTRERLRDPISVSFLHRGEEYVAETQLRARSRKSSRSTLTCLGLWRAVRPTASTGQLNRNATLQVRADRQGDIPWYAVSPARAP